MKVSFQATISGVAVIGLMMVLAPPTLASPPEPPDAIRVAAEPGLGGPGLGRGSDSPTTTPQRDKVEVKSGGGGVGLDVSGRLEGAELKRKAWMEMGGQITSFGMDAGLTIMSIESSGFSSTGLGFGLGAEMSRLSMTPPIPDESNTWSAFKWGGAFHLSFMTLSSEIDLGGYEDTSEFDQTQLEIALPIGWLWGLGSFADDNVWRGVVLGIDLRPSISMSFGDNASDDPSFNPLGFGLNLDFASFEEKMGEVAREAQYRLTFFFIPPVSDLLMLTANFGVVWY